MGSICLPEHQALHHGPLTYCCRSKTWAFDILPYPRASKLCREITSADGCPLGEFMQASCAPSPSYGTDGVSRRRLKAPQMHASAAGSPMVASALSPGSATNSVADEKIRQEMALLVTAAAAEEKKELPTLTISYDRGSVGYQFSISGGFTHPTLISFSRFESGSICEGSVSTFNRDTYRQGVHVRGRQCTRC